MKRSLALVVLLGLSSVAVSRSRPADRHRAQEPRIGLRRAGSGAKDLRHHHRRVRQGRRRRGDGRRGRQGRPFVTGLDDPKGIAVLPEVAVRRRQDEGAAHRRDRQAPRPRSSRPRTSSRPRRMFLNDIAVDPETGAIYVSDSGKDGKGGACLSHHPQDRRGHARRRREETPRPQDPQRPGDGRHVVPAARRFRHRQSAPHQAGRRHGEKVADGFGGGDGLAWDYYGRLYITGWKTARSSSFRGPARSRCSWSKASSRPPTSASIRRGKFILVPDMKAGTAHRHPGAGAGRRGG